MLNDTLANALSVMETAEKLGRTQATIKPSSKIVKEILGILKDNHYIGENAITEDGRGDRIVVNLLGAINKTGAIKPRFSVEVADFERFEKRFLPAKDFGILIVSTSKGIMSHLDAKKQGIGGKLLAYCY